MQTLVVLIFLIYFLCIDSAVFWYVQALSMHNQRTCNFKFLQRMRETEVAERTSLMTSQVWAWLRTPLLLTVTTALDVFPTLSIVHMSSYKVNYSLAYWKAQFVNAAMSTRSSFSNRVGHQIPKTKLPVKWFQRVILMASLVIVE